MHVAGGQNAAGISSPSSPLGSAVQNGEYPSSYAFQSQLTAQMAADKECHKQELLNLASALANETAAREQIVCVIGDQLKRMATQLSEERAAKDWDSTRFAERLQSERDSWQLGSDRLAGRLKDEKTARHGAELAVARERHSRQLAEERVAQLEAQLEGSRIRAADDKQDLAGDLTVVHQAAVEAAVAEAVAAAVDEASDLAGKLVSAEEGWGGQLDLYT